MFLNPYVANQCDGIGNSFQKDSVYILGNMKHNRKSIKCHFATSGIKIGAINFHGELDFPLLLNNEQ